jgi:DedD protein
MEDKNELSDIVLEKDTGKILKAKRVLIIISTLIILFLIVLLSMKLFNNPAKKETQNIVLPPEPTVNVQNSKKDEELFKQVPIIEENSTKKDNFENIVKNLKEKESKIQENKTEQTQSKTEATVQKASKVVAEKKDVKTQPKPKKSSKKLIANRGIYIQVGATSKHQPNKKFLKKISAKKLEYRLLPIKINGKKITKILIGPFKNRSTAKKNLPTIRENFNKNAFIYRIK